MSPKTPKRRAPDRAPAALRLPPATHAAEGAKNSRAGLSGDFRFLSVCSGIEAASVAWEPLGWRAAWFSQFDPDHDYTRGPDFASAVLAHRFPEFINRGDMTCFQDWPDAAIDLLVGGTPCQSFSVAGLRRGLDDPRGSLMLIFGAIARRYRPRWIVWENVPGVLSSGEPDGSDFGGFLMLLAELGYGFAWRVFDAQYFGLAQRRARVFVVGYLGDWRPPAAVLLERESLRRHPAPRRQAREDLAGALNASAGGSDENDAEQETLVAMAMNLRGRDGGAMPELDDVASLRAASGGSSRSYVAQSAVRRLTPLECERLQGFPDGWTAIPFRGRDIAADGPRYKALGNSMAVPVMRWIGERIAKVDAILNQTRETQP